MIIYVCVLATTTCTKSILKFLGHPVVFYKELGILLTSASQSGIVCVVGTAGYRIHIGSDIPKHSLTAPIILQSSLGLCISTTMTDTYPTIKQNPSQSPTLASELSPVTIDLFIAKEEPYTATSLYPLTTTAMDIDIMPEYDVRPERDASPSQSPTLVADISTQKLNMSCYTTPPPSSITDGTTSKSSTPPILPSSKHPRKAAAAAIQFISDLPVARESALGTFNEIFGNDYQFKSLGRSREVLESMTCDCTYEHG